MSTASKTKSKNHPWRTYGTPMSKQWGIKHKSTEIISNDKLNNIKTCLLESCTLYKS